MEEGQGYGEPSSAPPPAAAPPPVAPSHGRANAALVAAVIALVIALIGVVMFPGPAGEEGPLGPAGVQGDDGDDGDDGQDGATGSQGPQGLPGAAGADGADGSNGTACWDLNENGQKDVATEDINGDTVVDVLDCTGAQGLVGPQGPPGTPATVLWAVVELDGTLARGSGVVSTNHEGPGDYTVRFNQDVRSCAWFATLGYSGAAGVPPPGSIVVVGESADVTGVWVSTDDMTGTATDRSFHLTVMC